jgi:hypothetical protein
MKLAVQGRAALTAIVALSKQVEVADENSDSLITIE